jgi:hypothetical protein
MKIAILSSRHELWTELLPIFREKGLQAFFLENTAEGRDKLASSPPAAAIIDPESMEKTNREAHIRAIRSTVLSILQVNAAVHLAVLSFLAEEDFHDTFEGLGLLCSMPPIPQAADIGNFAASLHELMQIQA